MFIIASYLCGCGHHLHFSRTHCVSGLQNIPFTRQLLPVQFPWLVMCFFPLCIVMRILRVPHAFPHVCVSFAWTMRFLCIYFAFILHVLCLFMHFPMRFLCVSYAFPMRFLCVSYLLTMHMHLYACLMHFLYGSFAFSHALWNKHMLFCSKCMHVCFEMHALSKAHKKRVQSTETDKKCIKNGQ